METKEQLINFIKQWIDTEDEIKILQKQLKEKRSEKKILTESLVDVMKTNDIDCFDINNGKLIYTKNKVKSNLSKKMLIASLHEYFGENANEVERLSNHILNSRKEIIKENIKHKVNK